MTFPLKSIKIIHKTVFWDLLINIHKNLLLKKQKRNFERNRINYK
jgi:hypothetical protein